jgi:ribosome-associated protein
LPALKDLVLKSLDDDKAFEIETINISDQISLKESAIADYIIIASGTSTTQVKSLAHKLRDRLEARGIKNIRIEGDAQGDWVVVDMGDIVVHLFRPEVREFYNIEKMWNMPHEKAPHQTGIHRA